MRYCLGTEIFSGTFFPMHKIASWFAKNKEIYPWRENITPYRVWVSEVMLQQTRALAVVSYFNKWMEKFPSIEALSRASEEEVIKMWEGLGYYSRARNLHSGSKQIMKDFNGKLPCDVDDLIRIKGVGPYTAGAISAFAYKKNCFFVDGNISRVVARYFAYDQCILKNSKKLVQLLEKNLSTNKVPQTMEGLIELGQQVCKKIPDCSACPLKKECKTYEMGLQEKLPIRITKKEVVKIERQVALIVCGEFILLQKNKKGKVMAGLWEFPYISCDENRSVCDLINYFPLTLELVTILPSTSHSFTKYKAKLFPYLFSAKDLKKVEAYDWIAVNKLDSLPFSSGHKKIKENFSQLQSSCSL